MEQRGSALARRSGKYLERPQNPADVGQVPEEGDANDVGSDDAQRHLLRVVDRQRAAGYHGRCGESDEVGGGGGGRRPLHDAQKAEGFLHRRHQDGLDFLP